LGGGEGVVSDLIGDGFLFGFGACGGGGGGGGGGSGDSRISGEEAGEVNEY